MSVSTLAGVPQTQGGVFTQGSLDAINQLATDQNANNTSLAAGVLTGANTITAHVGGGQGSATALTAGINRVTVNATIGNSVALPAATAGLFVTIINETSLAIQVFGAGTDTINDVATATGVEQPGKSTVTYWCPATGIWYSVGRSFLGLQTITASGAMLPHVAATYVITKSSGAAVMTLAAPTDVTDDGKVIVITSSTAQAHTVTATGLFADGAGHVNLATFANLAGASMTIMAYGAKWLVISSNNVTFS